MVEGVLGVRLIQGSTLSSILNLLSSFTAFSCLVRPLTSSAICTGPLAFMTFYIWSISVAYLIYLMCLGLLSGKDR